MTTLARPPSAPTTTSSVTTGVACAFAQIGSCDMSMRVPLGGVPSNLTTPVNDAESPLAPTACPDTQPDNEDAITTKTDRQLLFFIFIPNPLSRLRSSEDCYDGDKILVVDGIGLSVAGANATPLAEYFISYCPLDSFATSMCFFDVCKLRM